MSDISPATDTDYDVVIAGSGAAGLTAAIGTATAGLRTLVIESATEFGGTSALSGGRVWIPVNGTPENDGDSEKKANIYLDQIFDPAYEPMIRTFVHEARSMSAFVQQHSPHRFVVCPNYPDYHQSFEGATVGGRCFDMAPVDLHDLVPESSQVRLTPGYSPITHAEWEKWRFPADFDTEMLAERMQAGIRTGGHALIASLVDGAVRAGAKVVASTELVTVTASPDGAVTSVRVRHGGDEWDIATRSVVLATGGFDATTQLRTSLLPAGLGVSASAPSDTGVAVDIAEALDLAVDNMNEGWWMPMAQVPGETVDGVAYPRGLVRERGVPRQILVNRQGERFLDEALPYNEFGKAMHRFTADGTAGNSEAYLVFDQGFRDRYPLPGLTASGPLPGHIVSAPDLASLAASIGVDADGLEKTVERWNGFCAIGVDADFHRGENAYDRYYGDPWQEGNRNLGPLDQAPFYAMRLYSGVIGSKGGPVTDTGAHVLRNDGTVLTGLYAAGNAAAFWTRDGYPGPGATLSVAMTFGYLAARSVAEAAGVELPEGAEAVTQHSAVA